MTTLRLLLGVVVTKDLELEQLDIKTTFLHRDLDEDIYISQSARFTETGECHEDINFTLQGFEPPTSWSTCYTLNH